MSQEFRQYSNILLAIYSFLNNVILLPEAKDMLTLVKQVGPLFVLFSPL